MKQRLPENRIHIIGGYLLCVVLIMIFVNMFPVVRYVVLQYGTLPVLIFPLLITIAALLIILIFYFRRKHQGHTTATSIFIFVGLLICLAALAVPDPAAPVKRIHVIEYMLLSLAVRYTMSFRLQHLSLLIFSILFSTLLGIHDELLQGLHPLRTYGLRDIVVNTVGAIGGSCIWHGFNLFQRTLNDPDQSVTFPRRTALVYLLLLFTAVTFLVISLYFYRKQPVPLWPTIGLLLSYIYFYYYSSQFPCNWKHGLTALSIGSLPMMIYPLAARLDALVFF